MFRASYRFVGISMLFNAKIRIKCSITFIHIVLIVAGIRYHIEFTGILYLLLVCFVLINYICSSYIELLSCNYPIFLISHSLSVYGFGASHIGKHCWLLRACTIYTDTTCSLVYLHDGLNCYTNALTLHHFVCCTHFFPHRNYEFNWNVTFCKIGRDLFFQSKTFSSSSIYDSRCVWNLWLNMKFYFLSSRSESLFGVCSIDQKVENRIFSCRK